MAPLIPYAGLIAAGVGVGSAVHTQRKASQAKGAANEARAVKRREDASLAQTEANANSAREFAQANIRESANQQAEDAQVGTMENIAEGEKMRLEQERLLAAEQQQNEYASKFSPGTGGENEDTASDFLVPKVADDVGLVRQANDVGGAGLVTPLTFG